MTSVLGDSMNMRLLVGHTNLPPTRRFVYATGELLSDKHFSILMRKAKINATEHLTERLGTPGFHVK